MPFLSVFPRDFFWFGIFWDLKIKSNRPISSQPSRVSTSVSGWSKRAGSLYLKYVSTSMITRLRIFPGFLFCWSSTQDVRLGPDSGLDDRSCCRRLKRKKNLLETAVHLYDCSPGSVLTRPTWTELWISEQKSSTVICITT